jgi:hypothetical protein
VGLLWRIRWTISVNTRHEPAAKKRQKLSKKTSSESPRFSGEEDEEDTSLEGEGDVEDASSSVRSSSSSPEPPGVDIEISCVAAGLIPKTAFAESISRGNVYLALMLSSDTFGNLRRHYAKHNQCVEKNLELILRTVGQSVSFEH